MNGVQEVSAVPVGIPRAWFCDRGNFWGTTNQLLLCAKCGQNEFKRHDEPRHFRMKPGVHTICDECFESLPE